MNEQTKNPPVSPPGLVNSVISGFNLVANHIYIILLPIALDLYLWFGPHLRIKALMEPALVEMMQQFAAFSQAQLQTTTQAIQELYSQLLQQFNLFSLIRSYPVGVFSLFSTTAPMENPLGSPLMWEVPTMGSAFLYWLGLSLLGLLLGTFFFREIARYSGLDMVEHHLRSAAWHYLQTILLTLVLLVMAFFIAVPLLLLFSFLTMVSPFIAQIALFVIVVFLLWLVVPMVFAPHGIYFNQQNAMASLLTSVRMVRFHLPGTSLFLMAIFLMGEGLNIIWRIAPDTSWMALVGVLGHAFVSTALLAASFIYYRNGLIWMQSRLRSIAKSDTPNIGRTL